MKPVSAARMSESGVASRAWVVWAGCLLVGACVAGVAYSLFPDRPTLANFGADGGDLLAAVLTDGVPHPTGYPTYVLLGKLFQRLPWGSPYLRGAWLSALPAALGAAWLAAWLAILQPRAAKAPALLAGLAWGFSPLLFSQAVIVEVHGLAALFALLALLWGWVLLLPAAGRKSGVVLTLLALCYGLGLGNHLTLLLFAPVLVAALGYSVRGGLANRWLLSQAAAVLLGLLVYLYLPLSAVRYPPVNWGNPQTLQGVVWLVSARPYQSLLQSISPAVFLERLLAWFSQLRQAYGLPGLLLGAAGIVLPNRLGKPLNYFLLWVFISYSALALAYTAADAFIYLIPAWMVWAVWICLALWSIWDEKVRSIPWGRLVSLVFVVYLLVRFPAVYRQVDPRPGTIPPGLLDEVPAGALVLAQSDPDIFSLWYDHFGLGQRADVAVVALPLTAFRWYQETLLHTYPHLQFPALSRDGDTQWGEGLIRLNQDRPVCRTIVERLSPSVSTESIWIDCTAQGVLAPE